MWIDMYIFWTAILLSLENNVGDAVDAVDAAAAVSESFARSFHGLWMDHNDASKVSIYFAVVFRLIDEPQMASNSIE